MNTCANQNHHESFFFLIYLKKGDKPITYHVSNYIITPLFCQTLNIKANRKTSEMRFKIVDLKKFRAKIRK